MFIHPSIVHKKCVGFNGNFANNEIWGTNAFEKLSKDFRLGTWSNSFKLNTNISHHRRWGHYS